MERAYYWGEREHIHVAKEERKLSTFIDDMIVYIKIPNKSPPPNVKTNK